MKNLHVGLILFTIGVQLDVQAQWLLPLWSQCGGKGFLGPINCLPGLGCFKKDKYYAACLTACPVGWDCNSGELVLFGEQCGGDSYCGSSNCVGGLSCQRKSDSLAMCLPECPIGWDCQMPLVDEYGQCGGNGYMGLKNCSGGLNCYAKDEHFSQCLSRCPLGWKCPDCKNATTSKPETTKMVEILKEIDTINKEITDKSIVSTSSQPELNVTQTTATTVSSLALSHPNKSELIQIRLNGRCGGNGYEAFTVCEPELMCFRKDKYYAECLKNCPPAWECNLKLAEVNAQCGGKSFCGSNKCSGGLRCMSKNETYAECQKNCPASWDCNKPQLDEWSQCGGAGFNGLTSCQGGLNCYQKDQHFSQCLSNCPIGWNCPDCS